MTRYRPYTGVGSRKTPTRIKMRMHTMSRALARNGFTLRSGGAAGADRAFQRGCDAENGAREIFLPWEGFRDHSSDEHGIYVPTMFDEAVNVRAFEIASEVHPAWDRCSPRSAVLHSRNVFQVLGPNLNLPTMFVICWTEGGALKGGTRTAIMLAVKHAIPVYNLGSREWTLGEIAKDVLRRRKESEQDGEVEW